jgi:hypothetical protein
MVFIALMVRLMVYSTLIVCTVWYTLYSWCAWYGIQYTKRVYIIVYITLMVCTVWYTVHTHVYW